MHKCAQTENIENTSVLTLNIFRPCDNSGGAGLRGIAKLAAAALAAADGAPAGATSSEAVEKNLSLGGGLSLDGITVAPPIGGEQLAMPGSSGGDDGSGAGGSGAGGAPGNSEEREGQDCGSQSSAGAGREDRGRDASASIASNASSRASSLATLSRRTSEAGVGVSEREHWMDASSRMHG